MPLVPPVLPSDVESVGALFPGLLNLPDSPTLDAFVQKAIDGADAWLEDKLGGNYGLAQFTWQVTQQRNGEIYLALERITDTVKSLKVYGSNFPIYTEDSPAFDRLIEVNWGQRAMECLDRWVTVEQINRNFAMPIFQVGQPIPETDGDCNGLEALNAFYAGLLDRSRGFGDPDLQTVAR